MNPFIENNHSGISYSSRVNYNRRKHDSSYFSRISYNTVEWYTQQSFLEQCFYLVVVVVFVILFTAAYFIYTEHYVFQNDELLGINSSLKQPDLAIETKVTAPQKLKPTTRSSSTTTTTTTTKPPHVHLIHHHVHHWPIIFTQTTKSPEKFLPNSIDSKSISEIKSTVPEFESTKSPIEISDLMSHNEILSELDEIIKEKINNLHRVKGSHEKVDTKRLLHLSRQMKSRNETQSKCSLIGLNHLLVPFDNRDFYWFKSRNKSLIQLEDYKSEGNITVDCGSECSRLSIRTFDKISEFINSCHRKNERSYDFKELITKLGFYSYLPENISFFDLNELFKSLDYQGVFMFKSIPDHLNLKKSITLAEKNEYPIPVYKNVEDIAQSVKGFLDTYLLYFNDSHGEIQISEDIVTTASELDRTLLQMLISENTVTKIDPERYSPLNQSSSSVNVIPNADYLVGLRSNQLSDVLSIINVEQPIYFYYYLLFNHIKKNLIHLDNNSVELYFEYFETFQYRKNDLCSEMKSLPFGLLEIIPKILHSENTEIELVKLVDYLMEKLIRIIFIKFIDDETTRKLIRDISFILCELVIVDQFPLNVQLIESFYDSLNITGDHFDNVQSIRSWFRSGYKEGCLLNYASL